MSEAGAITRTLDPESSKLFMAMIALPQPRAVPLDRVREKLRTLFGLTAEVAGGPAARSEQGAGILVVDEVPITLLHVDRPVPQGTFERAIASNQVWREAGSRLALHRSHAIVGALRSASTHSEALHIAARVALVAATVSDLGGAIGVYWEPGETVTEASAFREAAMRLRQGVPPVEAWVQLLWLNGPVTPAGERTLAVVTTGLRPFIGRELEFLPIALPPVEIAQRVLGLIQYLLLNGPVLEDGDTVGVSEAEAIRVRHETQGRRPGVPIMTLSVERLDPGAKR